MPTFEVGYELAAVAANAIVPSVEEMVRDGIPVDVVARWQKVRREMTVGLKRRVVEDRN